MAAQPPCGWSQTSLLEERYYSSAVFKNLFYKLCHSYSNYYHIYADGSKSGDRVGAAVVHTHRNKTKCVWLPNTARIFRAELYALLLAIDVVCRSKEQNFVIFSDSVSSFQAISGFKIELDLIQRFIKDYLFYTQKVVKQ